MNRKAIATVCMSGTLADKLAAAADAGYDGVEIFENDLTYFGGSPEEVRELAASLKLELVALQPFRDFEGLPEPLRTRAFDRAKRKFELMNRLGTQLLLVCSCISPDAIDDMARVGADLHDLGELARRTASRSASRPCAGAGTSTTTARPGMPCSAPTTRMSA